MSQQQRLKPFTSVTFNRCSDVEKAKQHLRDYKPTGGDDSITREYILNPFVYEPLMKFVPKTLAPNFITLGGFICLLISGICSFITCPTFSEPVPSWVFLVNGIALFWYQTLDNMDGKQARNTGTSSPLGELFDHGVDALATSIVAISFLCTCGQGASLTSYAICLIGYVPFIFATMEEYYIGGLYLGKINGPIEGVLGFISIQFVGFFFGYEFFHKPMVGQIPFWIIFTVSTFCASMYSASENVMNIIKKIKSNKKALEENKVTDTEKSSPCFETDLVKAFLPAIPFFVLIGSYFIISYMEPNVKSHPYAFLLSMGFGFGYLASNLTLSYLLKKPLATSSLICVLPVVYLVNTLLGSIIPGNVCLFACLIVSAVIYINYALSVIDDICNSLEINMFSLPKKKQ